MRQEMTNGQQNLTDEQAFIIKRWLDFGGIQCPRCGGGQSGYGRWEIRTDEDVHKLKVVCDNCFYPTPEKPDDMTGY